MLVRFCLCTVLLCSASFHALTAQTDTLEAKSDQLLEQGEGSKTKDPTQAALLSAVLPGLGQIYNKKYWKLPIVYGGAYALGYGIKWNDDNYNELREALFAVRNDNTDPNNPLHSVSEAVLERESDSFRRDRDFLIIASILAYFVVIVDSYVDAHLRDFPLGKDAAFNIQPAIRQDYGQFSSGLALSITF